MVEDKMEAGRSRRAATIMRMDVEPREMSEVRTVVRGHMVRGIYLTSNFRDEQVRRTKCGRFVPSVLSSTVLVFVTA